MSRAVFESETRAPARSRATAGPGDSRISQHCEARSAGLRIGPARDAYEAEADRAAERVISDDSRPLSWSASRVAMGSLQRACECGGSCEDCGKNKEEMVRRKPDASAASSAASAGFAPGSVSSVLSRPGNPLERGTRDYMESRFGYDFGRVRIHHDEQASTSARDVSAHAYTVGSSIVFGRGRYEPHSPQGRRLLAHELAHVVQQNGAAHRVQRQPDDKQAAAARSGAADTDEVFAALYSAMYSDVELNSPQVLLSYADNLSHKYEEAQGSKDSPLSRLELASILNRIYSSLKADESRAERDNDGALLERDFAQLEPWDKSRPRAVADIATFTPERILAWQADAAAHDRLQSSKNRPAHKANPHTPPPGFEKLVPPGQAPSATPPQMQAAAAAAPKQNQGAPLPASQTPPVQVQEKTQDEKDAATDPGSGPVVQGGMAMLKGTRLSALGAEAAAPGNAGAHASGAQAGDKSLLDACAQLWFLSNRMYLLDRSGHLAPRDDAWFDISTISGFKPGGVYFLKPGNERIHGDTVNFRAFVVGGAGAQQVGGAGIFFPRVLTAYIPVLEINEDLARRQAGVGLIIAPTFAQKQLTVSDISGRKLLAALAKVPGNLPWAVNAEINRIHENPLGEVANQALAFGLDYVSKYAPIVGQAAMLYQLIELSEWLGEVANVAAYAQTEDEVDIAAQAIARKLAQFVVFEAIHRGLKAGLHPEVRGVGGEEGAHGENKAPVKETPQAPGAKTEGAPAAQNMDPVGKATAAAVPREGNLASEGVDLPGSGEHHEVIANREGFGRCSDSPCPNISLAYAGELAKVPEFRSRYEGIRKLGETDVHEATKEAAGLVRDIEAYKLAAEGKPAAGSAGDGNAATGSGKGQKVQAPADTAGAHDNPVAAPSDKSVPKPFDVAPTQQKTAPTEVTGAADQKPAAQSADQKPPGQAAEQKPGQPAQDATATGTAAAPAPTNPAPHAVDDILSSDRGSIAAKDPAVRGRFTPDQLAALDRLDAAYQSYKKRAGANAQTPEGWLRSVTSGKPREDAEALFGSAYARGGEPGVPVPPIPLKEIVRPSDYGDARLQADLATVQKDASLWDRLTAVRQKGILNGEVPNAILNILKGNVGEILAKPTMEARLAAVKNRPRLAGARSEYKTYVERIKPDGTHEPPKLFSDGLIVTETGNRLQIHDVFEVKSGTEGGAEATNQFFEWREGRLEDGDRLVLSDGRKFEYRPGATGAPPAGAQGYVIGMQRAQANIVAPRGSEHLGTGSGDQIAASGTRTALPQTASEIEYLCRLLFESLPQVASPSATATPTVTTPP